MFGFIIKHYARQCEDSRTYNEKRNTNTVPKCIQEAVRRQVIRDGYVILPSGMTIKRNKR